MGLQKAVNRPAGRSEEDHENMIYDVIDEVEKIGKKYDLSINQMAVKWVLSKDWVTCPILGGSRAEHFNAMYEILEIAVDDTDIARLDEISAPFRFAPFNNQSVVSGAAEQKNWL
jgi:aryl-alcohol dehydrogenase-like predicted oxidoreductase